MTYFGLEMNEEDFENLHDTSMEWGKDWGRWKTRFNPVPSFDWKMAYWMREFTEALISREWLKAREEGAELVFDEAQESYLLLTNYKTEGWR